MSRSNAMLEGRKKKLDRAAKHTRSPSPAIKASENGSFRPPNEDNIMTRKPIRIRRPRIPILQSGYCAICNLPYNSVEDHIQSKKHQKLIGEDANYIALNGYIHGDVAIESLLSLTGIDAIGFDDFSPKAKRRTMPRTRTSSVMSDMVKSTPTQESESGHRLRSRKNVNYMTPPLDEDSYQEKQDVKPDLEPVRLEYKEYRELRSSTRALAKLTSCAPPVPEVWESGRPKRACISRSKRISADERLGSENRTYYKVEVLSSKAKPGDKDKTSIKQIEPKSNDSDKGLIVKFKKLRNSELVQLNNEATNFLFPKKSEASDDEEEEGKEEENDTEEKNQSSTCENIEVSSTSELEDSKPPDKFKIEDEASMDSTSSDSKKGKKRRSHAEAFIMDNQKYYKFEMPGSRLRYHGSYLSPVPTKPNGEIAKVETKIEPKIEDENKNKPERLNINLNDFTFSFETVPENEKWFQTFRRYDRSEQRYNFTPNYHWNDFVLPHQIPHLKALDPRSCYNSYKVLKECLCKAVKESASGEEGSKTDAGPCDTVEVCPEEVKDQTVEQTDDDSKLSEISSTSAATIETEATVEPKRPTRKRPQAVSLTLSPSSSRSRNSRKSPRQHASTLAILSSLNQRKRRSKGGVSESTATSLQPIPEEAVGLAPEEQMPVGQKTATPQKQRKKKVDYLAIIAKIDEELDTALDVDVDVEPTTDPDVSFLDSRLSVDDIIQMYESSRAKETEHSFKKFFNGSPVRKPAKRKKNLTGWPNKTKRRRAVKSESGSVTGGNPESGEEENGFSDSIKDLDLDDNTENKFNQGTENRVGNTSEIKNNILQPYVYVKKLDNCEEYSVKKIIIKPPCRRTIKRPRRRIIPTTVSKTPRMLRRPKGRWYRDR